MFYKKNETAIIDIAKKYLSGTYTFEEFVNILSSNKKAFNYLRKYSKNKLFFILPDLEKFRNIENTYWIRHNYYNLMYSYLYFLKINVDSFCEEYAIYRKLDKVLPEWFQLDVFLLYEMFPKLDELIEENKLLFELEKITDLTGYTGNELRIYGYLSERLINVWVRHNKLKTKYRRMLFIG